MGRERNDGRDLVGGGGGGRARTLAFLFEGQFSLFVVILVFTTTPIFTSLEVVFHELKIQRTHGGGGFCVR